MLKFKKENSFIINLILNLFPKKVNYLCITMKSTFSEPTSVQTTIQMQQADSFSLSRVKSNFFWLNMNREKIISAEFPFIPLNPLIVQYLFY